MKNNQLMMIAAGIAAGTVALIVAKRRRKQPAQPTFGHFKKNRHLTPAISSFTKHS